MKARGFRRCCAGPVLEGYFCNGFLSLVHAPSNFGHQLFQIVLGGLQLCRSCVHFPVLSLHSLPFSSEGASPRTAALLKNTRTIPINELRNIVSRVAFRISSE